MHFKPNFCLFFIFRCWQANIDRTILAGVVDTAETFIGGVVDTGEHFFGGVSLTLAINFRPFGYF